MHRHLLADGIWMDIQQLIKPVIDSPSIAVGNSPSGLERVFWIRLVLHVRRKLRQVLLIVVERFPKFNSERGPFRCLGIFNIETLNQTICGGLNGFALLGM